MISHNESNEGKCSECKKEIKEYVHISAFLFNHSNLCFECLVKWLNMSLKKGYFTYPYISGFLYLNFK